MMKTPATVAAAVASTALVVTLGLSVGTAMGASGGVPGKPAPATTAAPRNYGSAPGQVEKHPTTPQPVAGERDVRISLPAVSFTETVIVVNGHLRTPVLLADPAVTGTVRVIGAGQGDDCRATLTQGVVAWLDCTVSTKAVKNAQIVVTLSDGQRVTKPITAG